MWFRNQWECTGRPVWEVCWGHENFWTDLQQQIHQIHLRLSGCWLARKRKKKKNHRKCRRHFTSVTFWMLLLKFIAKCIINKIYRLDRNTLWKYPSPEGCVFCKHDPRAVYVIDEVLKHTKRELRWMWASERRLYVLETVNNLSGAVLGRHTKRAQLVFFISSNTSYVRYVSQGLKYAVGPGDVQIYQFVNSSSDCCLKYSLSYQQWCDRMKNNWYFFWSSIIADTEQILFIFIICYYMLYVLTWIYNTIWQVSVLWEAILM